jgi:hypothetical protein
VNVGRHPGPVEALVLGEGRRAPGLTPGGSAENRLRPEGFNPGPPDSCRVARKCRQVNDVVLRRGAQTYAAQSPVWAGHERRPVNVIRVIRVGQCSPPPPPPRMEIAMLWEWVLDG